MFPLVLVVGAVIAACVPTTPPGTTTTTLPEPVDPVVTGEACQPSSGVTVVVDFTALDNTVKIGCAPGEQADGFAALAATGFTVGSESGVGTVCTLDGLPTEGSPFCWTEGGYWSYWKSPDRSTAWDFSPVGGGDGPIAQGSTEGWSWAPGFNGAAPRVSIAGLSDHTPALPECEMPEAPVLSIIDDDEVLPFTIPGGGAIEIAVLPAGDDPSTAIYTEASSQALTGLSGPTRVLARSAPGDCAVDDVFDAVYDVRATYAGRTALNPDAPAVPTASPSILGWATGHSEYTPGADVTAGFQNPAGGYGSASSGLVVLGNGGHITMTFAAPITDDAGDDFAVFENGFLQNATSQLFFSELAYVEVSSNGTDFVRFDSASRRVGAVGAFAYQDPRELGGLAGKDPSGFGTPFDLTALRNKSIVRNGTVDLSAITHVRIVDVVGAADYPNVGDTYLDSFGRQILDAHKTTGSGGFDLTGVAILNQAAA
ncbi:MAG: hypothetical protein ACYC2O_13555 [Microthrixaceae bacterium]